MQPETVFVVAQVIVQMIFMAWVYHSIRLAKSVLKSLHEAQQIANDICQIIDLTQTMMDRATRTMDQGCEFIKFVEAKKSNGV